MRHLRQKKNNKNDNNALFPGSKNRVGQVTANKPFFFLLSYKLNLKHNDKITVLENFKTQE